MHPKRKKMGRRSRYVGHTMPAGAKVTPADDDGICQINGWTFYYCGLQPDEFDATTFARGMTT
jgi:hypothetical protein